MKNRLIALAGSGLSGTIVAIITFALCFAWSSGSLFASSISSVPKGQTEAGLLQRKDLP